MTALSATTFVFLVGTSLAISIERRVKKGIAPWEIGLFISPAIFIGTFLPRRDR